MNDQVSLIIVTFNNEKTIKICLESVFKSYKNNEVIVIDNNSQDDTVSIVKEFKNVKLLKSEVNLGFAKANNKAVNSAKGDYLVFLNPDTKILETNSFNKLIQKLKQNPEYGLVGPKLVYPDKKVQKSVRKLPTLWGAINEYLFGIKGAFNFYLPNCQDFCEVESVVGACIAIKKVVFESIGGWDERYFLYFEDLQLCRDLKSKGLKVGYVSSVVVEHKLGISGRNQNTTQLSLQSAQIYHGAFKFMLIQLVGRLGNKFKTL